MIFFSASRNGFFDDAIHASLPSDAVAVAHGRYQQCLEARSKGADIVAGKLGEPVIRKRPAPSVSERREATVRAVRAEASRRCFAIASPLQASADASDLAFAAFQLATKGSTSIVTDAAINRADRARAVRAAADAIEAAVADLSAAELITFDLSKSPLWPA